MLTLHSTKKFWTKKKPFVPTVEKKQPTANNAVNPVANVAFVVTFKCTLRQRVEFVPKKFPNKATSNAKNATTRRFGHLTILPTVESVSSARTSVATEENEITMPKEYN
jgi:hypothetical protein